MARLTRFNESLAAKKYLDKAAQLGLFKMCHIKVAGSIPNKKKIVDALINTKI